MKNSAITLTLFGLMSLLFIGCEKEELNTVETINDNANKTAFKKAADGCTHVTVCHHSNGKEISISINAAFNHIQNGGMLFSCNADDGLNYTEIVTALIPRIVASGGDYTDPVQQKAEFIPWYQETYCGVPAPGADDEGGTLDDGAGSDL